MLTNCRRTPCTAALTVLALADYVHTAVKGTVDKFCDFIQSETFADSIQERFPAYQNALETYVKQVLKDATCKK